MKKKIQPIKNYVAIKQDTAEETDKNTLSLSSVKVQPNTGVVYSVGEGTRTLDGSLIEMSVKEGDRVVFYNYAGTNITIDGETFLVLTDTDILCVINTEES